MKDPVAQPEIDVRDDSPVDIPGELFVDVLDENNPLAPFDQVQRPGQGTVGQEVGVKIVRRVEGSVFVTSASSPDQVSRIFS